MLHAADNNKGLEDHLQTLLKLFYMFKIRIWYDERIVYEVVPYAVGIMCINCVKLLFVC